MYIKRKDFCFIFILLGTVNLIISNELITVPGCDFQFLMVYNSTAPGSEPLASLCGSAKSVSVTDDPKKCMKELCDERESTQIDYNALNYRYIENGAKSCYIRACEIDGEVSTENLEIGPTSDPDGRIIYIAVIDECALDAPCQNGGICEDTDLGYICHCPPTHSGVNCDTNLTCSDDPCDNGTCLDTGDGGFWCDCFQGYTGLFCDTDIDRCTDPNYCLHGGFCLNSQGSFSCSCIGGFEGDRCQDDIDECAFGNLCDNGGRCENTYGSFTCICPTGYQGETCQNSVSGQPSSHLVSHDSDYIVPDNTPVLQHTRNILPDTRQTVNTTILMTYNDVAYIMDQYYGGYYHSNTYSMGQEGFVYGFQFYAMFAGTIRISIWRWEELVPLYYYDNDIIYTSDIMENGSYFLVGITDNIITSTGLQDVYLNESWRVSPNDFIGLTFGSENPVPYDVHPDCFNYFQNVLQTCESYQCSSVNPSWEYDTDYTQYFYFLPDDSSTYRFPYISHECLVFAVQGYLMPDSHYSHCKMIQLTSDYRMYSLVSHEEFGYGAYADDTYTCWYVRAADENSHIHADLISFNLEFHDTCSYDKMHIESEYGNSEDYCGVIGPTPDIYISPNDVIIIHFTTDVSLTHEGFNFALRSIDADTYNNYLNNNGVWPWLTSSTSSESPTTSSSTDQPGSAGASSQNSDLARNIGIGIGASVLVLIVIIVCIVCCCVSSKANTKKVRPQASTVQSAVPYPRQRYASQQPQQPAGIFTIPQPHGPPNGALPPLSTGMPILPNMPRPNPLPNASSNAFLPTPPAPYPQQRYSQFPMQTNAQTAPVQQPTYTPPIPKQPSKPSMIPPKHSLSTVAFALLQPKPLKAQGGPFGGAKSVLKTEAEMMALGRARLNWKMTEIPGPATYIAPSQWRPQNQEPAAVKSFQPAQNEMFAEDGISYAID